MKIYDVFIFNDELDLLECRLRELDTSPIYRHVIIEGDCTFQGERKPLYYADHQERFAPWRDRITHVVATGLRSIPDPWQREHAQREWASRGLQDTGNQDVLIMGDVDEIPTVEACALPPPAGGWVMRQRLHLFAVDWLHPDPWNGTIIIPVQDVQGFRKLRGLRNTLPAHSGGWHFSWLGGPDAIRVKVRQFSHSEYINPVWEPGVAEDAYLHGKLPGIWQLPDCTPVTVDGTWPQWIYQRHCPPDWFRPATTPAAGKAS